MMDELWRRRRIQAKADALHVLPIPAAKSIVDQFRYFDMKIVQYIDVDIRYSQSC